MTRKLSFLLFIFPFVLSAQFIPSYSITNCSAGSAGYYFMSAAKPGQVSTYSISHNIILDSTGSLVYFKKFTADSKASDFKLQGNGLLSYYSGDKFYLMTSAFKIVDSVWCKNGILTDRHDLQVLANGNYLVLGHENLQINLSAYNFFKPNNCAGSQNATVTCGVIQELDKKKNVVFEWHAKSYFKFLEMDTFYIADPKELDWTHFNAVEEDTDGNILLSVRNFGEITKINRKDSSIMWRLGGTKNEFTFINDPAGFKSQHDIRRLSNGHITLFNNGRPYPFLPAEAKEYVLDEKAKTITLAWNYINDKTAHSNAGLGNVQRLPNGSTLINYGSSNKSKTLFNVINMNNEKVFEIEFKDFRRSYRVFNFMDFVLKAERPKITSFKKNGRVYLDAGKGYSSYTWSTGAKTRIIPYTEKTKFYVAVPANDGGSLVSAVYNEEDFKRETKK